MSKLKEPRWYWYVLGAFLLGALCSLAYISAGHASATSVFPLADRLDSQVYRAVGVVETCHQEQQRRPVRCSPKGARLAATALSARARLAGESTNGKVPLRRYAVGFKAMKMAEYDNVRRAGQNSGRPKVYRDHMTAAARFHEAAAVIRFEAGK